MVVDTLVHEWLGVAWLVPFVVTVTPVTHQVDQAILVVRRSIHHGEPHGCNARFGIVGVQVHDRNIEPF